MVYRFYRRTEIPYNQSCAPYLGSTVLSDYPCKFMDPPDDQGKTVINAPGSFMGVPFSSNLSHSRAAVLGFHSIAGHIRPCGIAARPLGFSRTTRSGPPLPAAWADFNPLEQLAVVDCGNVI
ncbi:MAG: hypothetical protein CM1200mP20_10930 [Pseudomonadota bacterium]|nr:MAG: hypothetical protein CM1200mP20_10930 [Pseudomonadota bacterium]